MGTRHVIMVKDKTGVLKVCQYGQWDGYPEGQGVKVLKFCKDKTSLTKLERILDQCRFYNKTDDIKDFIAEYDKLAPKWSNEPDNRTVSMKFWFDELQDRDLGAKILTELISINRNKLPKQHKGLLYICDNTEFFKTGWCEWAYCINFQTGELEVYEDNDFLKKTYSLDELPEESQFVQDLTQEN